MEIEQAAPSLWEWALSFPSLVLAIALLAGLKREAPHPPPPSAGLSGILLVFSVHILAGIACGPLFRIPFFPRGWAMGASLTIVDAATCLAVLTLARRGAFPDDSLGLVVPKRKRNLLAVALIYPALIVPFKIAFWAWLELLESLGHTPRVQTAIEVFLESRGRDDGLGMGILALGAVALAPLAEELYFRSMIYGILRPRIGAGRAIFLASLAWAAIHILPEVMLPIFFLGIVLNAIYLRTGSLAHPLLFHMLFNGGTILWIFFQ